MITPVLDLSDRSELLSEPHLESSDLENPKKEGEDPLDEEDEKVDYENLPAAWKRHAIILSFGAAAAYFSTIPSQTITSVLFTLGFLKLSKSYMVGFPRFRRYCVTAATIGSALVLKSIWNQVDLTPLAAGLGIDTLAFTAKAYMKGKLKKDEGPEETNRVFLCAQKGLSKTCNWVGSCLNKVSSCASSCFGHLNCCFKGHPQVQAS